MIGILFTMSIDPSVSSAPFASIREVSHFQTEEEILFSMHIVFRIGEITKLGYVKDHQGDHKKAIEYYVKALEIQQKTLPSNHPSLATSYNNIVTLYYNVEEYSKAFSSY
jgi:tetratricopeptide (TPR) repeat protein